MRPTTIFVQGLAGKNWLFLALAITLPAVFAFTTPGEPLPIGAAMPAADIPATDISGKTITLKEAMQAEGLLVMFSCNTCPFVIRNQERTKAVCSYANDKKIGVILLNSNEASRDDKDSPAAMKAYAAKQGYDWYYAIDKNHTIADAFGANRTPECFLFDKAGKLVYHGAIDDNPGSASDVKQQYLKTAINEMVGGKTVTVQETRSVGCMIKRAG